MRKNAACTTLLILLFIKVGPVSSQGSLTSARQLAMGRSFVALAEGGWHLFGNPALMDHTNRDYSLQMNGLRPFGLLALQQVSVTGILPRSFGTMGAGLHRFGNKLYQELKASAGFSRRWSPLLVGGSLQYTHIRIKNYGSAGTVGINFGTAIKLGSRGWVGAVATNVNQPTIGAAEEELPQVLGLGASWKLTEDALITTEIIKDLHFPPSWRSGIEIKVVGPLIARAGARTKPTAWSAGIGIHLENFTFDFGLENHQVLGFSYGIGMGWRSTL